jgi:multidrug efflux pump subunit AcrA (membrane-fusion protein)
MDTEVDVPNPKLVLIPGMYAEVDLTLNQANNALAVPVTAVDLASDAEGAGKPGPASGAVMVVTPQNRLEARKVAVGMETANRIEIRSGLQDGEMVVIGNRAGLQAGQEVRPKVTELTAEK